MSRFAVAFNWIWKITAGTAAYCAAAVFGGISLGWLGLELPPLPASEGNPLLLLAMGGAVMAAALALLARGLAGPWWRRGATLAFFVFLASGLATALETRIFTTLGGEGVLLWLNTLNGVACALVMAALFSPPGGPAIRPLPSSAPAAGGLVWRFGLALLAFPFFYLLFGMLIAPIVTPYYEELEFLRIPAMSTLLVVLLIRSALFLLASLPILASWRRSRAGLVAALGLGHFSIVGLVGLIQTGFFPPVMRWTHGAEIFADSICYAAVLVWLLYEPAQALGGRRSAGPVAGAEATTPVA